jgi:hypothetical protein
MTGHENFLAAIKTEIHRLIKNPNFIRHVSEFEKLLPPDVEFRSFDDEVRTAYHAYEPDPTPSPLSLLLPPLLDQCIEPQAMTPEQHTDDANVHLSAKFFLLAVLYELQRDPFDEPIIKRKDAAAAVWNFYGWLAPRAEYERGARVRAFIQRAVEDAKEIVENPNVPDDLITLTVAIQEFAVSRATLKRAIASKTIQTYRKKGNSPHFVSRSEVKKRWPER